MLHKNIRHVVGFVLLSAMLQPGAESEPGHISDAHVIDLLHVKSAERTVKVSAQEARWQSAGVQFHAGDTYRIIATGQWKVAPVCNLTDAGGEGGNNLLCPFYFGAPLVSGYSHAALIGKVGIGGVPFTIGTRHEHIPQADGSLYMRINDPAHYCYDNSGFMDVTIGLAASSRAERTSGGGSSGEDGGGGGGAGRPR